MTDTPRKCSFCDKPEGDVQRLLAGPSALICNECLDLCYDIFAEWSAGDTVDSAKVCSFCGKDKRSRLVAGPTDYHVCDECVDRGRGARD